MLLQCDEEIFDEVEAKIKSICVVKDGEGKQDVAAMGRSGQCTIRYGVCIIGTMSFSALCVYTTG